MHSKKIIAVYPGSFDPITLGHVDIMARLLPVFDEIILLISANRSKNPMFSPAERKQLAEEAFAEDRRFQSGFRVDIHGGLTVDYLRKVGATVILRGLRAVTDFESELVMANMNRKLAPEIETMIVFASPKYYYVSSNTVKEVATFGGDVSDLVPSNVARALGAKLRSTSD